MDAILIVFMYFNKKEDIMIPEIDVEGESELGVFDKSDHKEGRSQL